MHFYINLFSRQFRYACSVYLPLWQELTDLNCKLVGQSHSCYLYTKSRFIWRKAEYSKSIPCRTLCLANKFENLLNLLSIMVGREGLEPPTVKTGQFYRLLAYPILHTYPLLRSAYYLCHTSHMPIPWYRPR